MANRGYDLAAIIALLRHATMSASYKPTLLAAIVRCVDGEQNLENSVSLRALAEEYLKMYWSQVVVFRLRHSPRDSAPPVIVQKILSSSERSDVRCLADLPTDRRQSLIGEIAAVLPVNVLESFHASKPEHMPDLYRWRRGSGEIRLSDEAIVFVRENSRVLNLIANYFLARFLSKLNAVPHIVEKVERETAKRESLRRFAIQLRALGESKCFYCDAELSPGAATAVDHFIPWTFVFEDRLWNLVPCCRACNSQKSDKLPPEALLDRLILLNKVREGSLATKTISRLGPFSGGLGLQHLYKLARDEDWPLWRLILRG